MTLITSLVKTRVSPEQNDTTRWSWSTIDWTKPMLLGPAPCQPNAGEVTVLLNFTQSATSYLVTALRKCIKDHFEVICIHNDQEYGNFSQGTKSPNQQKINMRPDGNQGNS